MKFKNVMRIILSVVATLAILFLPCINLSEQEGNSGVKSSIPLSLNSDFDSVMYIGARIGIGDSLLSVAALADVVAVVFSIMKKRVPTMLASLAGVVSLVVFAWSLDNSLNKDVTNLFDTLGIGIWICVIANIINVVLCAKKEPVFTNPADNT